MPTARRRPARSRASESESASETSDDDGTASRSTELARTSSRAPLRSRATREERRERGFVGRVVGALTPANWGFRLGSAREESSESDDESAEESESDEEEESEGDEDSDSAGTSKSDASAASTSSEGARVEEQEARRRRSANGTTTKAEASDEDENPKWRSDNVVKEPTPWISRDNSYSGPFRDNVKSFLNRYAACDGKYTEFGIMGYTVTLSKGEPHETTLRIYEEAMAESERPHCDCCRCIGWVHHPVNKRQYHFIVHTDFKARSKPELAGKRICQLCCCAVSASERKCSVCDEVDKECSILDHQTHLLHGLIHANGFGHLKRVNGREAGSMTLSGAQLMGLWETICYQLRAREVSVEDVSQKYGVELRLLNPVSRGATWYGTYGYIFGKGSFGNTLMTHKRATELLRKFPLRQLRNDFVIVKDLLDKEKKEGDVDMIELVDKYITILGKAGVTINTLGELVNQVMKLQRDIRLAVKKGQRAPERLALHGVAAVLAGVEVIEKGAEYKRNVTDSPKMARRPPPSGEPSAKKMKTNLAPTQPSAPPRTERARALRPREEETPPNSAQQQLKINLPSEAMVQWDARARDTRSLPASASRWSEARLNVAANACVLALRDAQNKWISRQEVRSRAREKGIGDTGLLDHILKTVNDVKVILPSGERGIVLRRQGATQMEFTLDLSSKQQANGDVIMTTIKKDTNVEVRTESLAHCRATHSARSIDELTAAEVDRDLLALYHDVLENYKPARAQQKDGQRVTVKGAPLVDAARILLDTKQFVKIYTAVDDLLDTTPASKLTKPAANAQKAIRIIATAVIHTRSQGPAPSGLGPNVAKSRQKIGTITRPPPELVFLPSEPTLGDLKRVTSKAFRDLYVVLSDFKVTRVKGHEGQSDKTRLGWRKMHGASVEVQGDGADVASELRYQGGFEQWTVQCMCGTGDDDGERMIACDKCGVWMHTRCVGIKDNKNAPSHWICPNCEPRQEEEKLGASKKSRPAPRRREK